MYKYSLEQVWDAPYPKVYLITNDRDETVCFVPPNDENAAKTITEALNAANKKL